MADALRSGRSIRKGVWVQIPPSAPPLSDNLILWLIITFTSLLFHVLPTFCRHFYEIAFIALANDSWVLARDLPSFFMSRSQEMQKRFKWKLQGFDTLIKVVVPISNKQKVREQVWWNFTFSSSFWSDSILHLTCGLRRNTLLPTVHNRIYI